MFDDVCIGDVCVAECDRLPRIGDTIISCIFALGKVDIIFHDSDELLMVLYCSCSVIFGDDLHRSSCIGWQTIATGVFSVSCSDE